MKLIVISPPGADPREVPALEAMLASGLGRYHVRKPEWTAEEVERWILSLPEAWRGHLVLHGHPDTAHALGLAGSHRRDEAGPHVDGEVSRSCHDLAGLKREMAAFPQVIFGPVFPSISKAGHGPDPLIAWDELPEVLSGAGRCLVVAVGGITAGRVARCRELGFGGVAAIGAIWGAENPLEAFIELRDAAARQTGRLHAA